MLDTKKKAIEEELAYSEKHAKEALSKGMKMEDIKGGNMMDNKDGDDDVVF